MQAIYVWASPVPQWGPRHLPRSADDVAPAPSRNRVLVIEDDAIVSLAMENVLVDAGYVILATCARGEDALVAAEREQPDLILADVKLAGTLDGVDAVAAILGRHKVPVIFVTAHTDPLTRERMQVLAPADILAKPISDGALLGAVAAVLRG